MPSDHSIPFTLRDHLHACLNCFPPVSISTCFPSSSSSQSRRLFSSSTSSTSSDDGQDQHQQHFPRNTNGHHPSPRNDQEYEEDIAAWGSDALSLRSQAGRGKGSRTPNSRRSGMGWFIGLFAGRRKGPKVDTLEDVEAEEEEEEGILGGWGGEGDWDDLPVPRGVDEDEDEEGDSGHDFDLGNTSDFDDDPEAAVEGEGEWGAFLSAPLTSARTTRPRSPSPSPPSAPSNTLPTTNGHHNHNNHNLHIITSTSPPPTSPTPSRLASDILTAHVDLPSTLPLPPSPLPPLSLPSSPATPLQPPAEPTIEVNAEDEDDAADMGSEYFASSTRPKSKSTRRSYTSSGVSSSTSATITTATSGASRSSSTRSSSAGGERKIAGSAGEPLSANPDTTLTLPSPSNLYGAPNPFSFANQATHLSSPLPTAEDLERQRKEEKKERKRARRERREARHAREDDEEERV